MCVPNHRCVTRAWLQNSYHRRQSFTEVDQLHTQSNISTYTLQITVTQPQPHIRIQSHIPHSGTA